MDNLWRQALAWIMRREQASTKQPEPAKKRKDESSQKSENRPSKKAKSEKSCRFFEQGSCKKGKECNFSHEIKKPKDATIITCRYCKKAGHKEEVCFSKKRDE
jgi:hypothetical protein